MRGFEGIVLSVDAIVDQGSICVFNDGKVLFESVFDDSTKLSSSLIPKIESAIDNAGIPLGDVGRFAVTTGPGSYTGIRVGIATIMGLARALDVGAVGVSTLEAFSRDPNINGARPLMLVGGNEYVTLDPNENPAFGLLLVRREELDPAESFIVDPKTYNKLSPDFEGELRLVSENIARLAGEAAVEVSEGGEPSELLPVYAKPFG